MFPRGTAAYHSPASQSMTSAPWGPNNFLSALRPYAPVFDLVTKWSTAFEPSVLKEAKMVSSKFTATAQGRGCSPQSSLLFFPLQPSHFYTVKGKTSLFPRALWDPRTAEVFRFYYTLPSVTHSTGTVTWLFRHADTCVPQWCRS